MFFFRELSGHFPRAEVSAPGRRLSCLGEKITPHLALETLPQLRLETTADHLDRRQISNTRLMENGLGGKWGALRDVTLAWEALTCSHELNVSGFFLHRNGRLYSELCGELFSESAQPVTDGGQNRVMQPSAPSLVKCDWATIKNMA